MPIQSGPVNAKFASQVRSPDYFLLRCYYLLHMSLSPFPSCNSIREEAVLAFLEECWLLHQVQSTFMSFRGGAMRVGCWSFPFFSFSCSKLFEHFFFCFFCFRSICGSLGFIYGADSLICRVGICEIFLSYLSLSFCSIWF